MQTVPIQVVQRLLHTAEHRGLDTGALCRAAGLSVDTSRNPLARVTVEQLTVMTQELWRLTDDELFGLGRQPLPRGTFRMAALELIHSPDLRTVLIRLSQFTQLIPGCPTFSVEIGESITRLSLDVSELDDPDHLVTDLLVAIAHRLTGWLVGVRIALHSVELPYPAPAQIGDYEPVFGRLPVFGASSAAITFDTALLSTPVVRDEAALLEFVRRSPSDLYAVRDYGSSTADQVRKILERGLRGEWPTADDVAARLTMSTQHLRRLLREQDTSMTQIKEDILRDAAIASLTRGQESVDDLAVRLGFSEASAFRRAFRRWTGSPPGAYRTSEADGGQNSGS